ncbi:conserved exported hypothetical protein [Vibrio nigripulchritudo FTn2]|uniref:TrbG/VirB9 family P-type conjugative transfer protein n=1 Tax=Vibrio nigripulchritudo TaxID=28173 RepID=UPI0003B17D19|nr:TrbG/VirB9 family P-type conjugative transfer protein [Vibrio nigripulchritudo]CCN39726.1 conserved exported hypothetical protein [Vibrio nigripulchritudo FTn2]
MKRVILILSLVTCGAQAGVCEKIKYKPGDIINIKSAMHLGTRIELPDNLIAPPSVSNEHLWDTAGVEGANQIVLKPNSNEKEGEATLVYAFLEDGSAIDIMAKRTSISRNMPCVKIETTSNYFNAATKAALKNQQTARHSAPVIDYSGEVKRLQKELTSERSLSAKRVKKSVIDALKKYRYRIYTRYEWDEGKEFVGKNTVSDVYDDGQFTYIRLANPNRGILSVETMIGGRNAIAPMKYEDAYAMYRVTGIYPQFTMRIDDVTIKVNRRDNQTKGNL